MNTSGSSTSSITALVPGGVVTTQNISTVIKPKENNNSMQFVKIQTPELSKKAVEQIRVAQESKITKDKIKEVEEEWQSNLLNWKSKRRQQFVGVHPSKSGQDEEEQNNNNDANNENGRKIKTFAEMIEQRAKAGNRLNFHLERYIGSSEDDNPEGDEDEDDIAVVTEDHHHDHDHHQQQQNVEANNNNVESQLVNDHDNNDDEDNNYLPRGIDDVDRSTTTSHSIHSNNNTTSSNILTQPTRQKPTLVADDIISDHTQVSISKQSNNNNNNYNYASNGSKSNGATDTNLKNGVKFRDNQQAVSSEGERRDEAEDEEDDDYEDEFADQRPINSTFIQGLEQPPETLPTIHSDVALKPRLDDSTANDRRVSLLAENTNNSRLDNHRQESVQEQDDDDEDDEEQEEEDEEEEEQKQLQRIAFVAKLKAFEKMTQPSLQEPRFVPTRTVVKNPPPPPVAQLASQQPYSSSPSHQHRQPQQQQQQQPRPSDATQPPKPRLKPQPAAPVVAPQPLKVAPTPQRLPETTKRELPSPIAPLQAQPQVSPLSSKPLPVTQPPPPPRARPRTPSPPTPKQAAPQPPPPPPPKLQAHITPPAHIPTEPLAPVSPSAVQPSQPQTRKHPPGPQEPGRISQQQQPQPRSPQEIPSPPALSPRQQPSSRATTTTTALGSTPPKTPLSPHRQKQQAPQPHQQQQPITPKQQLQPQEKTSPQQQDRTVLSVSGKKRCSSCKEELGRGAAAFVIESLNLVYHTNCFRCSVCHVNLSNGFRGVDVRVHAGALHCQNCYSKDGLNYSRV